MKNKLLALVLSAGLVFSSCFANKAGELEQIANRTYQAQEYKTEIQNKKEISTAELIKLATLEGSLIFVKKCKNNKPFKQQIEKYGLEKTAEHIAGSKFYWIDLAEEHVKNGLNEPNQIPEKKYLSIAKQIGIEEENFDKGYTDKLAKNVVKAKAKTGKIDTNYYAKLIKNNQQIHKKQNISEQYNNLIRTTFSEEEYNEYYTTFSDSMIGYYDELGKTLGLKIIFGKKDIDKMKKATLNYYNERRDELYPKKK